MLPIIAVLLHSKIEKQRGLTPHSEYSLVLYFLVQCFPDIFRFQMIVYRLQNAAMGGMNFQLSVKNYSVSFYIVERFDFTQKVPLT